MLGSLSLKCDIASGFLIMAVEDHAETWTFTHFELGIEERIFK